MRAARLAALLVLAAAVALLVARPSRDTPKRVDLAVRDPGTPAQAPLSDRLATAEATTAPTTAPATTAPPAPPPAPTTAPPTTEAPTTTTTEPEPVLQPAAEPEPETATPTPVDPPEPEPSRTPAEATSATSQAEAPASSAQPGGPWALLRDCESGGDYTAVQPDGPGRGAYQFDQPTWDGIARHLGRADLVGVLPHTAAPADQDTAALQLYDESGAVPWPHCGRYL